MTRLPGSCRTAFRKADCARGLQASDLCGLRDPGEGEIRPSETARGPTRCEPPRPGRARPFFGAVSLFQGVSTPPSEGEIRHALEQGAVAPPFLLHAHGTGCSLSEDSTGASPVNRPPHLVPKTAAPRHRLYRSLELVDTVAAGFAGRGNGSAGTRRDYKLKIRATAGALATLLVSPLVYAQAPQESAPAPAPREPVAVSPAADATSPAADATSPATDESAGMQVSAGFSTMEGAAGAVDVADPYDPKARWAAVPYLERYKPEGNLWELGFFGGVLFPSSKHNLKVQTLPQEPYNTAAVDVGMRGAYFPVSFAGLEVEAAVMPTATRDTNRSALLYAGRAQLILQLPFWSVTPFILGGGGVMGAFSRPMGYDIDPLILYGLGVKVPVNHLLSLRFDARDNLTQKFDADDGSATHNIELLLGLTVSLERTPPPAPSAERDSDRDGLVDSKDRCKDVAALTPDGCPADTDGDGVSDSEDHCPREAAATPTGCPELDADGDGVPAPCDRCPDVKGTEADGCPTRDADGDGITDDVDKCPAKAEVRNGFEDDDGCPDEVPEAVQRFTGVIQGITFEQGRADIRRESLPTLDSAYLVLTEFPSIRLEVSGHTSSEGDAQTNQQLSQDRAQAVKDYLVQKGVDPARIQVRGAGSSEPIADNATPAGRMKNRRIEFRILSQP